jgi:hypothetical protein
MLFIECSTARDISTDKHFRIPWWQIYLNILHIILTAKVKLHKLHAYVHTCELVRPPLLTLPSNCYDFWVCKKDDTTAKAFPDPYAPKSRDIHANLTNALLATALFRCWSVDLYHQCCSQCLDPIFKGTYSCFSVHGLRRLL